MQARCSGLLFVHSLTFYLTLTSKYYFICKVPLPVELEWPVSEANDFHFNVLSICENLIISLMRQRAAKDNTNSQVNDVQ